MRNAILYFEKYFKINSNQFLLHRHFKLSWVVVTTLSRLMLQLTIIG